MAGLVWLPAVVRGWGCRKESEAVPWGLAEREAFGP